MLYNWKLHNIKWEKKNKSPTLKRWEVREHKCNTEQAEERKQ